MFHLSYFFLRLSFSFINLMNDKFQKESGLASTQGEHLLGKISLGETAVRDMPYTEESFQTR